MGYTHYWYRRKRSIPENRFEAIVEDFKRILPAIEREGVELAGWDGTGEPKITYETVSFNGVDEEAHETLDFPRVIPDDEEPQSDISYYDMAGKPVRNPRAGMFFNFTKTARKPYDLAVTAFLFIAKHRLGKDIIVASDGEVEEWGPGIELVQAELGYPAVAREQLERDIRRE
jgi:hypothetical protein